MILVFLMSRAVCFSTRGVMNLPSTDEQKEKKRRKNSNVNPPSTTE